MPDSDDPPAPVAVWQGDQDRHGAVRARAVVGAHLPGARVHLLPGEGHLSLAHHHYDEILTDLLDLAGLRS